MSIASLIGRFGQTFYVIRPTVTDTGDGTKRWEFTGGSPVATLTGFFQPSSQSEDPFEGRANSRLQGTVYFEGDQDIRIEDELYTATIGSSPVFRVRGVVNPADIGTTGAAMHLNLTTVDVLQVAPPVAITEV